MPHRRLIALRLTGRPELEAGFWLVTPRIEEEGWCSAITIAGIKRCVPTGHYVDAPSFTDGRAEVWVPQDQKDDWPPHPRKLIDVLKDNPEGDPTP